MKFMRNLFICMFIANIVLTFASLLILPERVAIHFGPGGRADNWASSHFNALLMTTVQVILFCAIYFNRRLVLMFPRKMINLPNREYWLSPANFDMAMGKIQDLLWNIGAVMFLLLFVMGLLSLKANLSAPARLDEVVSVKFSKLSGLVFLRLFNCAYFSLSGLSPERGLLCGLSFTV